MGDACALHGTSSRTGYKDALKGSKLYTSVFGLLSSLFALYKHYLQRANLKAAFATLDQTPGTKLTAES